MLPAERLPRLVADVDLDGVDDLLRSLDGDQRRAARRWFDGSRGEFRDLHRDLYERPPADDDPDLRLERAHSLDWIEGMCAVALLGPATAARRVPWRDLWDYRTWHGEDAFVHLVWDADRDWAGPFVDAASRVSLGGNARNTNGTLSRVLRAVAVHHRLPCPTGPTFLNAWLAGAWRGSLVDTLRQDPLMPELLLHYLASGHSGSTPDLPDVTRLLVDEGRVDRERVVEVVLEQLTTAHRVGSQRVLAGLLRSLEVKAAEIPGGLAYLLGVLATCHGSVGTATLPLALELVDDDDGLAELVALVAARPERKHKELLLRALQGRELRDRVGNASAVAALRTLADGDDDVMFVAKVAKARSALGDEAAEAAPSSPATLGLWAQSPAAPAHEPPEQPSFRRRDLRGMWRLLLVANWPSHEGREEDLRARALWEVGSGRLDVTVLRQEARRLLVAGELSAPRAARLFEDLFLSGAMSATWDTALTIADEASGRSPRPARLDVLLRMLGTYAAEAPDQDLPPGLAALATSGTTKAALEARALGAALRGVSRPGTGAPVRGLWHETGPSRPLPTDQPVTPLPQSGVNLAAFEQALGADYGHTFGYLGYVAEGESLTRQDLLLRDAVVAIRQHGPEAVRARVLALHETGLAGVGPVRRALELWAAGSLAVDTFWRLALEPPGDQDRWTAGPAARLTVLRCCETLLRVGALRALLSTPTYEDGTLDLDRLLLRLRAAGDSGVGPLDLVQALYRLRPTDASRAAELDLPPVPVVAALASPEGDTSWDAVETVRSWVAAGGLPPLDARPAADGTAWVFHGDAPVSWEVCRAAPPMPSTTAGTEWDTGPLARVFPLQPDRVLSVPFPPSVSDARFVSVLTRMGGTFGLAVHDYVLAALSRTSVYAHKPSLDAVLQLLAHDRLDAALLGQTAVGRAAAGTLALADVTRSFEELFVSGGFRRAWPLACAVADAVRDMAPDGLPALQALLAAYAREVPA